MNTIQFGPRNGEQDPALARAAELPKDIAPPHDLWPAIAERLQDEPQRRAARAFGWPAALAAGLLVAAVSALLTWSLVREPAPVTAGAPRPDAAPVIVPVNYGSNSTLSAAELAARDELLVEFRRKLDQLSPQTRETVVRNLAVIQGAADEIGAALAQDPASGLLNELLLGTYKQELQLYSNVVTAGDDSTRRT
jgi:hypothetical protein